MKDKFTLKNRPKLCDFTPSCLEKRSDFVYMKYEGWFEGFKKKMENLMLIYGDDPDLRQFIQQEVLGK